jgi:very-short-patch-repair endonuclease
VELRAIDQYAQDHHGLITREAAMRHGLSRVGWYRALADGSLAAVHPGVARVYGAPITRTQQIAAAVFAAGRGAMASHRSAALLWGVPRPDTDPIDVMLDDRRRETTLPGVLVHRPRDRRDLSPVLRQNVRCSNVLRFLCDLGAVDEPSVSAAVGHVVTNGLASPRALRAAVEVHARRGRHGVPALRRALEEWIIDGRPVDSVLEKAMQRLIEAHGLPAVEFHARVAGFEVDFRIVDSPIVLECDGWEHHAKTPVQQARDAARDGELVANGLVPVRFTYRQITRHPARAAERLRRIIRRWAPHLLLGGIRRST